MEEMTQKMVKNNSDSKKMGQTHSKHGKFDSKILKGLIQNTGGTEFKLEGLADTSANVKYTY